MRALIRLRLVCRSNGATRGGFPHCDASSLSPPTRTPCKPCLDLEPLTLDATRCLQDALRPASMNDVRCRAVPMRFQLGDWTLFSVPLRLQEQSVHPLRDL